MRYLYLHGFASGPQSRKAQAFRSAMARHRIELEIPDLARGDFEHLTISAQLNVIEELLQGTAARLIGSSMGGYLAALYASAHPEIERLVLLAPAFSFAARWRDLVGSARIEEWRSSGWLEVFHYGDKAVRRVHFGLFEDAARYPAAPDFHQPARIFQGINDDVVPINLARAFTPAHPNAVLTELDSDHELLNVLDDIICVSIPFLIAPEGFLLGTA